MRTKIRSLLLLSIVTLFLAACRIVVNTEVKSDGSGQLRTAVVYTAKEKEDFTQKPENKSKSICDGTKKGVPADATFVEEIHDGETYCITERAFNNLDELRKFYANMGQVRVNTLQFELGKFTLDVDVDLTADNNGGGPVNEWHLTLPGEIGVQNADRVEGQTLVWVIQPNQKAHLHAESAVALSPATLGATGNLVLIVVVAGVLALVLLVSLIAVLLSRRNRQK
jgi:hypothetical protein